LDDGFEVDVEVKIATENGEPKPPRLNQDAWLYLTGAFSITAYRSSLRSAACF
jgi:hypothetical protein